jgi:hypothetical protein
VDTTSKAWACGRTETEAHNTQQQLGHYKCSMWFGFGCNTSTGAWVGCCCGSAWTLLDLAPGPAMPSPFC